MFGNVRACVLACAACACACACVCVRGLKPGPSEHRDYTVSQSCAVIKRETSFAGHWTIRLDDWNIDHSAVV